MKLLIIINFSCCIISTLPIYQATGAKKPQKTCHRSHSTNELTHTTIQTGTPDVQGNNQSMYPFSRFM